MRNFVLILLATLCLLGCDNSKKELAKTIINSYALAVKEQDEGTMKKLFPSIKYFTEYPKIDRIEIKDLKIQEGNVLALCSLYYQTGLGKQIEQEIKFLFNPNDSTIIDVLGILTRKQRNEILGSEIFTTFPEFKPNENDMDVSYIENRNKAFNRSAGFKYFAGKAIGERTKLVLNINCNKFLKYGVLEYWNNAINLSISNNSDFTILYSYIDDNYFNSYRFSKFKDDGENLVGIGCVGVFELKPNETVNDSYDLGGQNNHPLQKENIKIAPMFKTTDEAIKIVNKYCDENTINIIKSGNRDFMKELNEYNLNLK